MNTFGIERLIVAPHCDDEVLGCGGLLAKYPGTSAVVVMSQPDEVRWKEFRRAQEILGYVDYQLLGLEDGYLNRDMHMLVGLLDRVIAQYQPHSLYLPYPSMHQDHVAGYEAGVRAGRLSMSAGHWFTRSVFVYDVAAYDLNLFSTNLQWNVFESLTQEQVACKIAALEAYGSQAMVGPHPSNAIKESARSIGNARQLDYAEQFALIRSVL